MRKIWQHIKVGEEGEGGNNGEGEGLLARLKKFYFVLSHTRERERDKL